MNARLLSKWGETRGARFDISREASIGRGQENTVVLQPKSVSSDHARIVWDDDKGCFFLEDLGSLNGTELDGVRVVRRERLGRLHMIDFGGACRFIFMALGGTAADAVPTGTLVDEEMPTLPAGLKDQAGGGAPAASRTLADADGMRLPESLAGRTRDEPKGEGEDDSGS